MKLSLALLFAFAVGCGGNAASGDDDGCDDCTLGMALCDGSAVRTCIQDGACTRFSDAIPCDDGLLCSGGECTDMCTDQCTVGATRCAGDLVQECEMQASGCTDYSAPTACADGDCTSGSCPGQCSDQCTVGATRCSTAVDGVETCATQGNGCAAWGTAVACQGAQTCTSGACTTCTNGATRCSLNNNVEQCTNGQWFETQSCAFGCMTGTCQTSVTCTPGAHRCNGPAVEICNSSGTAYLHASTCSNTCSSGLCTGACTPGTKRCNGGMSETCNAGGTAWENGTVCTSGCDGGTGTCALAQLEITANTNLDGEIVVNGPVTVRSGATLTSPTGNLTIRATSITVELNGSIAATPTGENSQGAGGAGASSTACGGHGGGYGTMGNYNSYCGSTGRGPAFGSLTDAIVEPGGKGGNSPSGATGGKGGGVIRLIAGSITIAGQVTANGNQGSSNTSTYGAGGGGSGGGILIAANTITISGTISAAGGAGGINTYRPSYSGASGGDGRIKILRGLTATVTGTTIGAVTQGLLPPLTISSSTHPDPSLIYNDDFSIVGLSWDRAFPSTQGYYHRTSTTVNQPPTPAPPAQFVAGELVTVDRTSVVAGSNYFHIVPVDATSAVGTVENKFRVQVNTVPPTVSSSSHPSQTAWSATVNAFFSWTLPNADANHKGYYYVLDHYGDTMPPTTGPLLPVTQKQILLSNLTNGIWAFHLVSIDQRGYRTKAANHYKIRIGTDPGVGTLLGTVTANGSPVQGAKVRINRSLVGTDQTSLANGAYNFGGTIPAGTWEVSVEMTGYQTQTQTVTVTAAGSTTANFALVP
ncbi:MAG: carboxypeptidase-like regulatory domain-containing protein [Kofleriaceae bacterium]|nr:carboxypeptidase-like regulatory domain-containing protein [Kofleriaceae bacterium]